jgi:hypothetical protein
MTGFIVMGGNVNCQFHPSLSLLCFSFVIPQGSAVALSKPAPEVSF